MGTYTVFIQQANGRGTTWIQALASESPAAARERAIAQCCSDWGYDESDVRCLGIAEGDVNILFWDDLHKD